MGYHADDDALVTGGTYDHGDNAQSRNGEGKYDPRADVHANQQSGSFVGRFLLVSRTLTPRCVGLWGADFRFVRRVVSQFH